MKSTSLLVIAALFISSSQQVTLKRAGFIDCEATGSCAPKKPSNVPEGFLSGVPLDNLYTYSEQEDSKDEVKKAKNEIAQRKLDGVKREADEKKRKEKEDLEREIRELKEKTHEGEEIKKKQQMALQTNNDVHVESDEEFVALDAEPKLNTAASIASGDQFNDESSEKSAKEVKEAKL